jgi:alpha-galactosidase
LSLGLFASVEDCPSGSGGEGHEVEDAASYAAWGVDYVKYVQCEGGLEVSESALSTLGAALAATGRPTVLSVASPPFREWMRETAQLWRTDLNIQPTWSSLVRAIDATVPLAAYAGPGGFNDPDMLEIGNGALTLGEQRVQLSVWSILAAPLIAGNDLTVMSAETAAILGNKRVIALDQDPLGLQGALVRRQGGVDVLAKPLSGCGERGVVLWNRSDASEDVSISWGEIWLEPMAGGVHDLWIDSPVASDATGLRVTVPAHDAVALRVSGVEPTLPGGRSYLSDVPLTYETNGFGPIELDRTNGEAEPLDGGPIRLRGAAYEKGLGVHAPSLLRYRLGRACSRFEADVGIDDDQQGAGSVELEVWADGERLWRSGVLTGTSPARTVSVDVSGRRDLRLFVGTGGDTYAKDHAVWAGARLDCDAPLLAAP